MIFASRKSAPLPHFTSPAHHRTLSTTSLYSTDRTAQGTTIRFGLGTVDTVTGVYTQLHANVGDLRGLAAHPTNPQLLFGIRQNDPDLLVTVDVVTGSVTIYRLPGLRAFNILLRGALGGGATTTLRFDETGKSMCSILSRMPLPETSGTVRPAPADHEEGQP